MKTERTRRDFEFALFPLLRSRSGSRYITSQIGNASEVADRNWINQTFHPRNSKFVVDIIGYLPDGSILHIEQETSHIAGISIRMFEYSANILIHHEMRRKLRQVVFYTGDRAIGRNRSQHNSRPIHKIIDRGFTSYQYLIIDAGSPSLAAVEQADLPAAGLGLLTRDQEQAVRISHVLMNKIAQLPEEDRQSTLDACIRVAALRGWDKLLIASVPREWKMNARVATPEEHTEFMASTWRGIIHGAALENPDLDQDELNSLLKCDLKHSEFFKINRFVGRATSVQELAEKAGLEGYDLQAVGTRPISP